MIVAHQLSHVLRGELERSTHRSPPGCFGKDAPKYTPCSMTGTPHKAGVKCISYPKVVQMIRSSCQAWKLQGSTGCHQLPATAAD